MFDPMLYAVKL